MTDPNQQCPRSAANSPPAKARHLNLPMIDPLDLSGAEQVADMIDNVYAKSGFNARRLAEAAHLYKRMIDSGSTISLTLSGAMTPIGMSGVLNSLIEAGFVDCMISTGANLYHDMHRPFDSPMMQGHFEVDDNELADTGIARIYDVFIEDEDTLLKTDRVILDILERIDCTKPLSTAELHYALGREIASQAKHPEWSTLVTAAKCGLPIYTSSPGDSSIAMNLAVPHMFGHMVNIDPLKDVIETAAIVRAADTNGVVVVGGGSPKNFYFQTQPTLHQIFMDESPAGHDYVIQLGTDPPHWGGLSGATLSEARSWGKIADAHVNNTVVYSCASITLPLLAQYVLVRCQPREPRRLITKVGDMVGGFYDAARRNPKLKNTLARFGYHYDELNPA